MTKEERLILIRDRFNKLRAAEKAERERERGIDAVLPVKKSDIKEEMHLMDTFIRFEEEQHSNTINSDEK